MKNSSLKNNISSEFDQYLGFSQSLDACLRYDVLSDSEREEMEREKVRLWNDYQVSRSN